MTIYELKNVYIMALCIQHGGFILDNNILDTIEKF